jgi:MATE family multidrug resistance protein
VQNKLLKSSGSVFNLLSLSTPVFLSLLSSSMMLLCDRYFLSCYSLDALNAVAVAGYLIMLFQLSSSRLTSINQVFVGRSIGEGRLEKVGAYTWQMIWGALLTQMIILPLGLIISTYYFANTEVEHLGRVYFLIILLGSVPKD